MSARQPQTSLQATLASPANRAGIVIALMLVLAAAWGLWPALQGVHRNWSDKYGHFSHGYLVFGMALWLAWSRWRNSTEPLSAPTWLVLPVLAALVAAMAASQAMSIDTITQSLLPLVLLAAISATYGWRVGQKYFWPVCFLYAALPVWWLINTPLQQLTAFVANVLVRLTGVPAYVEGNSFHLPAGTVHIAAGCSGLSYLNAAVALALFQGLQYLHGWKDRLKLLAVTVVLALAFNWLRVYSLIVIAYASDMQNYLIRVDHLTYGWILFAFCIWPVFWYGVRLERRQGSSPQLSPAMPDRAAAFSGRWQASALAGILAATLLLVPATLQRALARGSAASIAAPFPANAVADNWLGAEDSLLPGAEEEQLIAVVAGNPVWVYRAAAHHGTSSGDWPLEASALLGRRWEADHDHPPVRGEARGVGYLQQQGRMRDMPALSRSGLRIGGMQVNSGRARKLALLQGAWKLRQDALLWVAVTPCTPDCPAAAARLDLWMRDSSAAISGFPVSR